MNISDLLRTPSKPRTRGVRQCSIPGCTNLGKRNVYSPLCGKHIRRKELNGHPEQVTARLKDAKPYIDTVKRLLRRLPHENRIKLEGAMHRKWLNYRDWLHDVESGLEPSYATRRCERAATELLRVFDKCDPVTGFTLLAAVFLWDASEPGRFKAPYGLEYSLVNLFTHLGPKHSARTVCRRNGVVETRTEYRVAPKSVRLHMADWLTAFATPFAARMLALSRSESEVKRQEQELLLTLFSPVKAELDARKALVEERLHIAREIRAEELSQTTAG